MKRREPRADIELEAAHTLARPIARWFKATARPLPWRIAPRDPYLSFVSEFMLQQTQISRVLEKFPPFIDAFPSFRALARAPKDRVLALWSGMGYYRRASNLHAAAQEVVARFHGRLPSDFTSLLSLPGVGRYTAGALASIVFNQPVPIVDGNVSRVLMRIRGRPFPHASPKGLAWAWKESTSLISAAAAGRLDPALVNEGLMELGATVCTPRSPDCPRCPIADVCVARSRGLQDRIPRPKTAPKRGRRFCESILIADSRSRLLVEQRPDSGMWAGLWQAPTWERSDRAATASEVAEWIGLPVSRFASFIFATTHRDIRFTTWRAEGRPSAPAMKGRRFLSRAAIASLALSSPQRSILIGSANLSEEIT